MAVSKKQQASVHKYVRENYDRLNVTVRKGVREIIKAHADNMGESVNSFINRAIDNQMEADTSGAVTTAAAPVLSAEAQAHIDRTGETAETFVARAVHDTMERDTALLKMGLSPVKK